MSQSLWFLSWNDCKFHCQSGGCPTLWNPCLVNNQRHVIHVVAPSRRTFCLRTGYFALNLYTNLPDSYTILDGRGHHSQPTLAQAYIVSVSALVEAIWATFGYFVPSAIV
jgi:hypothetical protein